MRLVTFAILLMLVTNVASASDSIAITPKPVRPVASAYTVEVGGSHLIDTYLTPLEYDGWDISVQYERLQAMKFNPERWIMRLAIGLEMDRTKNPSGNATMWYGGLNVSWGMMHRWRMPYDIILSGGGSASLDAGCLYNERNGNNPASAKAAITANITGSASWNGKIGRLPITVRYQPTIPVIGAFFSPDYGELYYEIYLGNHSGLAHPAWWGNYFKMENLVTIDLHFSNTSLRIGYHGNILSTKVNDITSRMVTNNFLIGVSGEWIRATPRLGMNHNAEVKSAIY